MTTALALLLAVVPALYTVTQAHDGAGIYMHYCSQCHGADLQGGDGPALAGTRYLANAKSNEWTLRDVRATVAEGMPFNAPGSLTPQQYADVMAFLLAANCFPAGNVPFPSADEPALDAVELGPLDGVTPSNPQTGTCAVK
jgi:polar amino acid transport system substrate-binding protein